VEPRGLSSRLTMLLYPLTTRSPDHALDSAVNVRARAPTLKLSSGRALCNGPFCALSFSSVPGGR
jgi:hypothetical protein